VIEPIADDETFIRHVHPSVWPLENEKPNSGAFRDDELSIDRERLRSVPVCCQLRPDHGFMRFTVADVVAIGLVVVPDPLPPRPADAAQEEFPLEGWTANKTFSASHGAVFDSSAKGATLRDGRDLLEIHKKEGFRAFKEARDAAHKEPWLRG
jgi:hypothetical protein